MLGQIAKGRRCLRSTGCTIGALAGSRADMVGQITVKPHGIAVHLGITTRLRNTDAVVTKSADATVLQFGLDATACATDTCVAAVTGTTRLTTLDVITIRRVIATAGAWIKTDLGKAVTELITRAIFGAATHIRRAGTGVFFAHQTLGAIIFCDTRSAGRNAGPRRAELFAITVVAAAATLLAKTIAGAILTGITNIIDGTTPHAKAADAGFTALAVRLVATRVIDDNGARIRALFWIFAHACTKNQAQGQDRKQHNG